MAIEMTDTEISRRLALAIGYRPEEVEERSDVLCVRVLRDCSWQWFDHQHEHTIYPIAEHFKMFPQWDANRQCWLVQRRLLSTWSADASACIALAVIEASERGLL